MKNNKFIKKFDKYLFLNLYSPYNRNVRHHNSFGGRGLIDRISQKTHTALMLLVELVKSQRLSVEKNPM